ncbi:MAG: hypothetical protein JSV74_00895 [Dehalococcoidia bacterium]|nr:MAG: hypothetical protein JSV74_00895 [Dehalococcoidia bacterium]
MFARIGSKPVLDMPGYLTSCSINAYIRLLPAPRKIAQLPAKRSTPISAILGEKIVGSTGCKQFLPVRIEGDTVKPIFKESRTLTGTAKAVGYIIVNENIDFMQQGQSVKVILS